jgi:RNA polymerase sigma-70 factor (ECF subfamily)
MPEESIEVLVKRFQSGIDQEGCFQQIYRLYFLRIINFFLAKGFSYEESKDLTQESFFQIYLSLPTFRRESHFGRWAFEVARRIYFNEMRRRSSGKRRALEESLDFYSTGTEPIEEAHLWAQGPDPLDQVILQERSQVLRAALEKMPESMRRCCKLRYEQGLKYQEIATVMNVHIETVKAHLHQARKRLQDELGKVED